MHYAWIYDRLAIVANSMIFANPSEGDEHGVRLEVRIVDRVPHQGSASASQPIHLNDAVWRTDIFESILHPDSPFDRAHFHPIFRGGEPIDRQWDPSLSSDPYRWLENELMDIHALLARAQYPDLSVADTSVAAIQGSLPELLRTVEGLWSDMRAQSEIDAG